MEESKKSLVYLLLAINVVLLWTMVWQYKQLNAEWSLWNFRSVAETRLEEP